MDATCEHLRRASRIALDIEADSFHHYYEKTCLIQVSAGGADYIIDPLAGFDLGPFLEVLAETPLILHDGGYDLRMLRASFDFRPNAPVFDTMLAARLIGIERYGLTAMIEQVFDVHLPKTGQKSDWSRRPLSEAQLTYAAMDTHYLERLADRLARRLERLGRTDWHRQCCRCMVEMAGLPPREKTPDRWRIKGSATLTPRQLAYLRALWYWREREAQNADRPPFKILGNGSLIELAVWAAEHPNTCLEHGPKLPRHFNERRRQRLRRALARAGQLRPDQWPGPRKSGPAPPDIAEVRKRTDRLLTACRRIAHGLQIAPDLLASRAAIEAVARARPSRPDQLARVGRFMPWQVDLLKDILLFHEDR